MDYHKHYNALVERGRRRVLQGYSEKHHVVPRCIGGSNDISNLVKLTPEEHYLAHQLLIKMYPDHTNLVFALVKMTGVSSLAPLRRNKLYGWLKRKLANEQRLRRLGTKRPPHSEETKRKMSLASKGVPKSEKHRAALSKARTGRKFVWSDSHRAAHAKAMKTVVIDLSYRQNPAYRVAQSEKMKSVWASRTRSI